MGDLPHLDALGARFRLFAEEHSRGYSPLYEALSWRVAEDEELLALLARARPGQRRPVLFMAAVNYLGGIREPAGSEGKTQQFDEFRAFCLDNRDALLEILETRATQTNEVGRSAVLLPAFLSIADGKPLALIEVGCSAGLNLLFDRYSYDYGNGAVLGDGSPLLRCDIDGFDIPASLPTVASRTGIDREPIDVTDDDAVAWLRACIYADQVERRERLEQAVATARTAPPTIVSGDAVSTLRGVVEAVPADTRVCIFHTWVVTYFLPDEREAFFALLNDLGRERDLAWLSGEAPGVVAPLGLDRGPETALGLVTYTRGERSASVLGTFHPHGTWLRVGA